MGVPGLSHMTQHLPDTAHINFTGHFFRRPNVRAEIKRCSRVVTPYNRPSSQLLLSRLASSCPQPSLPVNALHIQSQVQSRSPLPDSFRLPNLLLLFSSFFLLFSLRILVALQGNKSFVPFSNLTDADSLTKTWKVRLSSARHSPSDPELTARTGLHQGR